MTDRKQVQGVRIKDEDEGRVRAIIATLNTKDKDGDIVARGAFGTQEVAVSGFGHTTWQGAPPTGKGTVTESGDKAVADVEFFLDTTHGRDQFRTVKRMGDLQEWSFGFDVLEEGVPSPSQRERGAERVLKSLQVHEVSPVLRGAGIDTGTLAAKCDRCAARAAPAPAGAGAGAVEAVVEDARATLRRLEDRKGTLTSTIHRHPDREVQALGEFALSVGYKLVGYPGIEWKRAGPDLKWFVPHDRTTAWMVPGRHEIHVSVEQKGEALVRSILHESKHLAQSDPEAPDAEDDAHTFARRWTAPVKAAHRATDGEPHRVHVEDTPPPYYGGYRPGDVVLSRGDFRAYTYCPRNTSSSWSGLAT